MNPTPRFWKATSIAAAIVTAGLSVPAPAATFGYPTYEGLMVDYCAEIRVYPGNKLYREGCGRDAAIWFCRRAGFGGARFWDVDSRAGSYNTVHMKSLQRCIFNPHSDVQRCRGFRVIECG